MLAILLVGNVALAEPLNPEIAAACRQYQPMAMDACLKKGGPTKADMEAAKAGWSSDADFIAAYTAAALASKTEEFTPTEAANEASQMAEYCRKSASEGRSECQRKALAEVRGD